MKLTDMWEAGKLDDFRFIPHVGEDGDKDHIHLLVFPSKRLDFTAISHDLREVDLEKPGMTLGVMPWRRSEPDHWLMYALHDEAYLLSHSKNDEATHKVRYTLEDVYTPYPQLLQRDYKRAVSLRDTDAQRVINALRGGMTAVEIMYTYDISPVKVQAITRAYQEAVYSARRLLNAQNAKAWEEKNKPLQVDIGALCSEGDIGYEQLPVEWEEK